MVMVYITGAGPQGSWTCLLAPRELSPIACWVTLGKSLLPLGLSSPIREISALDHTRCPGGEAWGNGGPGEVRDLLKVTQDRVLTGSWTQLWGTDCLPPSSPLQKPLSSCFHAPAHLSLSGTLSAPRSGSHS